MSKVISEEAYADRWWWNECLEWVAMKHDIYIYYRAVAGLRRVRLEYGQSIRGRGYSSRDLRFSLAKETLTPLSIGLHCKARWSRKRCTASSCCNAQTEPRGQRALQ